MTSTALVVVLAVAAAVPLLRGLVPRLPLPGPLLELLAGIALGPTGFGWVHVDPLVSAVAVVGMAFLLFLAGFEVDVRGLAGPDGKLAGRGLVMSVVLAGLAALVLLAVGWPLKAALLVASALMATSVGLVGPLLKDVALLGRPLGRLTLAGAALGEVTAVLLISVGFSLSHGPVAALAVLAVVIAVGGAAAWAVSAASRRARIAMAVRAQAEGGGQARIRLTVLAVTALALLASKLGLEAVLGAFLAGGLARLIDPDPEATHPAYPVKLDAIGFGFLVPVFFVTSGLKLDLRGVLTDPSALVLVPLVFVLLLAVRGLPALAFRHELGGRSTLASGLLLATSLPFLLIAAEIGQSTGVFTPSQAGALAMAGLCSVIFLPPIGLALAGTVPRWTSGDPQDQPIPATPRPSTGGQMRSWWPAFGIGTRGPFSYLSARGLR
ncbi:MAG: cation:proton antiporter [Actinomycetota bacterium]|nr:cation:proton antiporter [Actinomycetota bacterium]